HQRRRSLYFRDLFAHGLRRDHGRLGIQLEISVSRRAAFGRADGVVRSLDRIRDHYSFAVRRIAEPVGDREGAGRPLRPVQLVLVATVPDVRGVLYFGAGGDQPATV